MYYGFYCDPFLMRAHMLGTTIVCGLCITTLTLPVFRTPNYRGLRAGSFILTGAYGVVPLLHMLFQYGFDSQYHYQILMKLVNTGLLYLIGAMLYAFRLPERLCPGRFDVLVRCPCIFIFCLFGITLTRLGLSLRLQFSSHQIFHLFVVAAAVYHYFSVIGHYEGRVPCVAS